MIFCSNESESDTLVLIFTSVFGLHKLFNPNVWLFRCYVLRHVHELVANFGFKSIFRCKQPLTLSEINADGKKQHFQAG